MKKILVAILTRGPHSQELNAGLLETMLELKKPKGFDVVVTLSYKMPVDANRNSLFKTVLEDEFIDYVLMVDSDIEPPKDILDMVKYKKDIVSGMIMIMKSGVPTPCAMKLINNKLRPVGLSDFKKRSDSLIEV